MKKRLQELRESSHTDTWGKHSSQRKQKYKGRIWPGAFKALNTFISSPQVKTSFTSRFDSDTPRSPYLFCSSSSERLSSSFNPSPHFSWVSLNLYSTHQRTPMFKIMAFIILFFISYVFILSRTRPCALMSFLLHPKF